eukprot:m.64787 g.64787  ORF g.64787 m.64787 type:complete len:60 (+) comp49748_c0_seq1:1144-1323(+)
MVVSAREIDKTLSNGCPVWFARRGDNLGTEGDREGLVGVLSPDLQHWARSPDAKEAFSR